METKPTPFNVLITSLSRKIPLIRAVRNTLDRIDQNACIIGADASGEGIGRFFTDGFWQMPLVADLHADDVVCFCQDNHIRAIIPTRDGELVFYARNREIFEAAGVSVMVSSLNSVRACIDKRSFYDTLRDKAGMNVIPVVDGPDRSPGRRWVVKERYGAGSSNVCVGLTADAARHSADRFDAPIFQPFIEGLEYSIDVYVDQSGTPKGCIVRTRDVVMQGESQVTTTTDRKDIAAACLAAADHLGLTGHMVFQAIEDANGDVHLVECNSRFGGASTLSIAAGLDSFYWFFRECLGDDLRDVDFVESPKGLRQVRYAADEILTVD